ncbi:MAG: flagellar protein FlgN [Chitinispirillaceae bacterium]
MDAKRLFDDLIQLLIQENDIHRQLINIATAMNRIIKHDDIASLQKSSSKYDEQICLLEKTEERRIECCNRIKRALGEQVSSNRLITLMNYCDTDQKSKLEELKSSLNSLISELSKINTSNSLLLEEGITAIAQTFDMIRESARQKNGYRHKGDFSPRTSGVSVFNQVM